MKEVKKAKGILIAVVAVLVLSAYGASAPNLVNANLRVTDFPEGSVIEEKPNLRSRDTSLVGMRLPNGNVYVRGRVTRQQSPSEAAAEFQDGCATPYDDWKVVDFVANPRFGDVSRGELWTQKGYSDLHVVCFSMRNLGGMVTTGGAKDADIAITYARRLSRRMAQELENPTGG